MSPFQPVSSTFSFVEMTAGFDEVENGRKWGAGRLEKEMIGM